MNPEVILLTEAIALFHAHLQQRKMSQETIRGYGVDLRQFQNHVTRATNGPLYVDEVTEEKIESYYQTFVTRGCKPATLRRKLNSISSFFTYAVKKKWIAYNPTADIERVPVRNQERTFLTTDELQAILQHIDQPIIYYFLTMMANTGLRVSECANLTLQDVDLTKGIVHVIEGKGGKNRDVPMNKALQAMMTKYLQQVRPSTASLKFFAIEKTGGVSPQYVNVVLKRAVQAAGITKPVTSHTLRHSFASQLVQTDTHVAVIQRLLGHADVRTTSVYMHANTTALHEAVGSLNFIHEGEVDYYEGEH